MMHSIEWVGCISWGWWKAMSAQIAFGSIWKVSIYSWSSEMTSDGEVLLREHAVKFVVAPSKTFKNPTVWCPIFVERWSKKMRFPNSSDLSPLTRDLSGLGLVELRQFRSTTQGCDMAIVFSWQWGPLHRSSQQGHPWRRKERLFVTHDYISPFVPLDLMWHMPSPLLFCVTGKTFCLDFPLIPCLFDFAQGPKGSSFQLEFHSQQRCR